MFHRRRKCLQGKSFAAEIESRSTALSCSSSTDEKGERRSCSSSLHYLETEEETGTELRELLLQFHRCFRGRRDRGELCRRFQLTSHDVSSRTASSLRSQDFYRLPNHPPTFRKIDVNTVFLLYDTLFSSTTIRVRVINTFRATGRAIDPRYLSRTEVSSFETDDRGSQSDTGYV